MTSRADAEALDRDDELAAFRAHFVIPDQSIVYLDGNSLGRLPRRTPERLAELMNEWGAELIGGWQRWLDQPSRVGDQLAPLIGARPGEVIVHDSTSINIYQLLHAALQLRPDRRVIAVDPADFPSDTYIAASVAASRDGELRHGFDELDDVAVVLRSLVDYRTAALADLIVETRRARDAGALVIWDLSHAVGAVDLDVHAAGSSWQSGAPTSSSTAAPVRRASPTSMPISTIASTSRSTVGSADTISSPWTPSTNRIRISADC